MSFHLLLDEESDHSHGCLIDGCGITWQTMAFKFYHIYIFPPLAFHRQHIQRDWQVFNDVTRDFQDFYIPWYTLMPPKPNRSPFTHTHRASTCIWTCPWPQTGVWGTVCGRCRCCGHSQAAGRRHAGRCSSSLHLWGPPAPQHSAAWPG